MNENEIFEKIFSGEDRLIIKKWLLDGSTLPNETDQQSKDKKEHFQIISHENFKFAY